MAAERLIDDIWGDAAPASTGPLRTYVWQLRRLLGPPEDGGDQQGVLVSRASSYLLDIDREQVDSMRFERLFAEARTGAASGQADKALACLDDALALWRGPAFGDLAAEEGLQAEATRLDQLLLGAQELRADLLLTTGQHAHVTAELEALARANPQRERLWAMLMTALYRSGRQGEALRCFQEARERLVEEMGIEPGPELRELEQAVLRHDPTLDRQPRPEPRPTAEPDPASDVGGGEARAPGRGVGRTRFHNLPRPLTSFVGRDSERRGVAEVFADCRLVTLTGSGGCGKTRLALAIAEDLLASFRDGVWFVDLSAVTDPELVARAVAGPLGVETEQAGQLDHLCQRIGTEQLLLVLDNCEHLVEVVAEVAEHLLLRCPGLHILATSREELRIGGEHVWRVPALSLPNGKVAADHFAAVGSEAVQLFIERGRSALAGFAPSGEPLGAVVQICQRLDGLPLAIELAAALVGSLPVSDIAERLDDRFRLLTPGRRQGIPRHRTLQATLDWSFDLLDEEARALFVRLGVFVGDFSLAAAEKVAGSDADPLSVVRGLGHLVATSMVSFRAGADGADRYRMLETIRQYARDRLEQLDEADEIRSRHARYYADFAAEAERHVHGPAASQWLARLNSEMPNLRAAVAWAIAHDDIETGLRLSAGALPWYFARMTVLDEVARWLEVGLSRGADLRPEARLMALTASSTVAFMRGDFTHTARLGDEGLEIARQLDDDHQLALALIVRGATVVYEGDLKRAEECFEEAHGLCARLGDRWSMAWLLSCWAVVSRRKGELDLARRQLEECLETFRALDDEHGQVLPLVNLALGAQEAGDIDAARELANEAVRLATGNRDRQLQHVSLCVLGRVELSLGHLDRARALLVHSIRGFPGAHNHLAVAIALEGLAGLSVMAGRHSDAAAVLGSTQQLRERWQISSSGSRERERDDWLDTARATIGEERVQLELARGRGLDLDDTVSLAAAATEKFAVDPGLVDAVVGQLDAEAASGSVLPH